MAIGYCLGSVFAWKEYKRQRFLFMLGTGLCLSFIFLRFINIYGDPTPWSSGSNILVTTMSFLNCEKYPPSLLFLLMTTGPIVSKTAVLS